MTKSSRKSTTLKNLKTTRRLLSIVEWIHVHRENKDNIIEYLSPNILHRVEVEDTNDLSVWNSLQHSKKLSSKQTGKSFFGIDDWILRSA